MRNAASVPRGSAARRARSLTRCDVVSLQPLLDHSPNLPSMMRTKRRNAKFEQLTFDALRYHTGRGGPRLGAGRPSGVLPRVLHRQRQSLDARTPQHVTIRLQRGLPTLRQPRFVRGFRISLSQARVRHGFRVVHYSIQRNHVHLLIEARDKQALARGMKSVGARIGKLVNRLFERSGTVLDSRYHVRPLRTPLEVRRASSYVLLNHRHHAAQRRGRSHGACTSPDPASSGRSFDGWRGTTAAAPAAADLCEVAPARTWLLRVGWRRHRLIDLAEVPG